MDMRHLRCFVAVAEEMHFGRAAKRLHLTQPPVSLAIKELEDELGVRLFERTSRRMALTPAGAEALQDARAVLASADLMRRRAQEAAQGLMGSLSLGFISLPAYAFLPPLLRRFTQEYPRVKVTLLEGTTDQLIHDVESGRIDMGLVFQTSDVPPALETQLVMHEPLVVALPEQHPAAALASVPLGKLAQMPFLGFERHNGPMMFDAIVATCMAHGFSPQIFPARQMHTIVSMVSGGLGVALVPACMKALQREGVVYRPLRGVKPMVSTEAVWRRSDQSPVTQAFRSMLPQLS
jgi:DNA-binding transcriptional LysR family regulator